jgi:hypothetical protein
MAKERKNTGPAMIQIAINLQGFGDPEKDIP